MDSKSFNEAPLAGTFFKFTIPVVCAGLISVAYNMVDTYFIALTGNTALVAGVSLISPIFTLMSRSGICGGSAEVQ